jgi:plasmid stabilization system protein ParE
MSGYDPHPEAFTDIDELASYIGEGSPEVAHRMVDEIHSAIQQLVAFPQRGHCRPDLTDRPLRVIRVRDSLVA